MGHGICWQPPFYFSVFLRSVKPFVDPGKRRAENRRMLNVVFCFFVSNFCLFVVVFFVRDADTQNHCWTISCFSCCLPIDNSLLLLLLLLSIIPVTYGKIVIIKGSYEAGSKNDQKMNVLIGPDWRNLCNVDGLQQDKTSSPGYDHSTYWPHAVEEELQYFQKMEERTRRKVEEEKEEEEAKEAKEVEKVEQVEEQAKAAVAEQAAAAQVKDKASIEKEMTADDKGLTNDVTLTKTKSSEESREEPVPKEEQEGTSTVQLEPTRVQKMSSKNKSTTKEKTSGHWT